MNKYVMFFAKATVMKRLGELISAEKETLEESKNWYMERRTSHLEECEANGTPPSEWQLEDIAKNLELHDAEIAAWENIEKMMFKEMGV